MALTTATASSKNNPAEATHPPILGKMVPDGKRALALMDPQFRDSAARDIAKLYVFKKEKEDYLCHHPETGGEISVNDERHRGLISQVGASQWTNLFNLMQYLFVHQSGAKKGTAGEHDHL